MSLYYKIKGDGLWAQREPLEMSSLLVCNFQEVLTVTKSISFSGLVSFYETFPQWLQRQFHKFMLRR
jgi:hypothetical protein